MSKRLMTAAAWLPLNPKKNKSFLVILGQVLRSEF
jgi:hypothetical protein